MKNLFLIIIIISLGLTSCKKEKIQTNSSFAQELRNSPETISIGNNNLILEVYLWRDFMPIAEENGSKMICVAKLIDIDNNSISNSIQLKKQYVIKENEIWTSDYGEIKDNIDSILEGVVRNGPKWGPDIEVDVVCEFEDSGTIFRLLVQSQTIHKTE